MKAQAEGEAEACHSAREDKCIQTDTEDCQDIYKQLVARREKGLNDLDCTDEYLESSMCPEGWEEEMIEENDPDLSLL